MPKVSHQPVTERTPRKKERSHDAHVRSARLCLRGGLLRRYLLRRCHGRARIRDAHFIKQTGWVAHVIGDAPLAHTHGLDETYGHLEFEVLQKASPIMR